GRVVPLGWGRGTALRSAIVSVLCGEIVAAGVCCTSARGRSAPTSYAAKRCPPPPPPPPPPVIPSAARFCATVRGSSSQFNRASVHQCGDPSTIQVEAGRSRVTLHSPPAPPVSVTWTATTFSPPQFSAVGGTV